MKVDKIKIYLLELVILAILCFVLFIPNNYTRILLAILLTICAIVTILFIKKRKIESVNANKVSLVLIILAIIYLAAFYVMGLYFGYNSVRVTFGFETILHYIIPIGVTIISSEIMRNILLIQNVKFTKVITYILMVLIDLILYVDIYSILNNYDKFIEIIGFTLFASLSCNLLFNYISSRYGIVGNIFYKIITILYVYIIPFIPNVPIFFQSIIRMIYPYIIYLVLEYSFAKNNTIVAVKDKRRNNILKVILISIAIGFIMLISCQFKYGILVIGSGSMTGFINKGDAIVYENFNKEKDVIEEGQIIVFKQGDRKIVHRVIDIKLVNGEIRYVTKGDANSKEDDGYITNKDVFGIYKFKISYAGYPSIWLRDIFSK